MNILLIDDNLDLLNLLQLLLTRLGYCCYCVSSVEDANNILDQVDVVVVDSFDDKSELYLAKECKDKEIYCIYHTGRFDVTDEEFWLFHKVVIKPGVDYLIKIIQNLNQGEEYG